MFRQKLLSMVLLVVLLLGQTVPQAYAATVCDQAQFVSDITVPDGAAFVPGAAFTKTWRFTNAGTCTWTTSYKILQVGGDAMSAPASVKVPVSVPPGQMLDISVNLKAPATAGHFKGLWKFANASNVQFGIGDSVTDAFWVDINVIDASAVIYDFVANAHYAQWASGAGLLPYPGASGDYRGYAYQLDQPHIEDDSYDSLPGLLTVPQNKLNGYIQATYPEIQIQQGDKLQTLVSCEFGATGCYATFRIDYILPNNIQKTLWSWKESYDKRFYRANIDLSALAGQKIRFILVLLASGSASGDRAIWGAPRIVRAGAGQPPAPPSTLTPLPPLTPTQTPIQSPPPTIAPTGCDRASFVIDVNVPDGTIFAPGAVFSKTWRLKNIGTCAWTTDYKAMYYSGEQMSAPTSVNMPLRVAPGATVDLTINMVAPGIPGQYRGFWILANASGALFGIGTNASNPFWIAINVAGNAPQENGYNFWQNVCSAQWKSGAGVLPCPGAVGDINGLIIADGFSHLEDGTMGPLPTLLMAPQNKYNGYIQGTYPALTVQPGDHFRTVVGCEYGYGCYTTLRLDYMAPNGSIFNFWTWREQSDKKNNMVDVDLSPLAGRSVRFILTTLAAGSATGDLVRWGEPVIVHTFVNPVPPTITPVSNNWLTYTNPTYGFQFKYPSQAQIFNQFPESLLMNLPIITGTNLTEKYLQGNVTPNTGTCQSPFATSSMLSTSETVTINGIAFLKQTGGDGNAGNFHDWVAYSTVKDTSCISMGFVLHYLNAGSFDPPKPEFDRVAELAVFDQMMSTFTFPAPPTITPSFTPMPPTLTLVPPTLTPMGSTVVNSPSINQLYMIDASNGWAIGSSYLLRTTNGGVTWYNILPQVTSVTGGFFPNSSTAWAYSSGVLYRTTNGGLNWSSFNVPFRNSGSLQFIDSNTGYMLEITGAAMNKQSVILYKTTDGGATWTAKYNNDPTNSGTGTTLPLGGHKTGMTFINATTGWVSGDSPLSGSIYLYKTTDSGVTWTQQSMTIPSGYTNAYVNTSVPKFFSSTSGVLPVWMGLDASGPDLFLYRTTNGGSTWTISSSFVRPSFTADVITATNAITWGRNSKFRTTSNTGASWADVIPNINFGDNINNLDFVSTTTGWLTQYSDSGATALYRTSDGGRTWTLLSGNPPPTPTFTPVPPTSTPTPTAAVTSLKAKVIADKLSCRYGPGAEYLYLYALNATANITLIGRTDANNWVWVSGTNKCWVNSNYITISGDPKALPIVYPGTAKLPVSPYYPGPAWASAVRNGNSVGVEWQPVPISAGKYADANMHQYILEVWRCEAGKIIFETLGTNSPSIVVAKDEPGCSTQSHGRVFVQEKHGYGGPIEPPWPQPNQPTTSTPAQSPSAFAQTLVDTLNARNFNALPPMMDASLGFAYWQSQGTSYPSDQAIQSLQTGLTVTLIPNANKDLTTLLNGSNPYSIMGLDPAKSYGLFVSGWGSDSRSEAILYVTQRANGSLYWHSTLIAPTGFVTPSTLIGPYAVVNVAQNDVLNIRSAAGVSQPIVGYFASDATDVMETGATSSADGAAWVEVRKSDGVTGWVNAYYLTEYVTHAAFCADSRVLPLIEQVKQSMVQSNGNLLGPIVSPVHGVNMHLWAYGPGINFTQAAAANIYTNTTVYNWGGGPSGIPDTGTFNDVVRPKYADALNAPNRETYCDDLTKVFPLSRPWPYPNIRFYNLYKPATGQNLDFRTVLVGIEYVSGQPYVYSVVTIIWEP
jgi:photosystem II stability/assembly factor-like uncharacterized protein